MDAAEHYPLAWVCGFDVCRLKGLNCVCLYLVSLNTFFVLFRKFEGVLFRFLCCWVVGGWGVGIQAAPDQPLGGGWRSPPKPSIQGIVCVSADCVC